MRPLLFESSTAHLGQGLLGVMQIRRTRTISSRLEQGCLQAASPSRWGLRMHVRTCAYTVLALILAAAGAPALAQQTSPDAASASGTVPSQAQPEAALPAAASTPAAPPARTGCTSFEEFFYTDCPLSRYGVTLYGAYDIGVGWVSHGLPENGYNYEGESLVNRNGNHSQYLVAPNNLSQTGLGLKGTEEVLSGWSVVFNGSTGINPQSGQLAH